MEIPGFEQCEKSAESGFVSYWQAFQRSLNRHVTLMLVRPDAVADPAVRRSFLRDIRVLAGLKHLALFQVYDVLEMDAALVVVVEHLSGVTLRQYVRQQGLVDEEKALTIARWMAEGLSHVYEKTGLVHLALTPDQIWIDAGGQVKILGFGFRDIFEKIGYAASDIPFLAPEQVQRQSADFRADLYAVGALLYYMITGRAPFEGNSSEEILRLIVKGQLPAPMTFVKASTLAVNQHMARLMMKEPARRPVGWFATMQEMDKVLNGAKFLVSSRKGGLSAILLPSMTARARATEKEGAAAAARSAGATRLANASTVAAVLLVMAFWGWLGWRLWKMPPPELEEPPVRSTPAVGPDEEALP